MQIFAWAWIVFFALLTLLPWLVVGFLYEADESNKAKPHEKYLFLIPGAVIVALLVLICRAV